MQVWQSSNWFWMSCRSAKPLAASESEAEEQPERNTQLRALDMTGAFCWLHVW
jgi:hypothetical protein